MAWGTALAGLAESPALDALAYLTLTPLPSIGSMRFEAAARSTGHQWPHSHDSPRFTVRRMGPDVASAGPFVNPDRGCIH